MDKKKMAIIIAAIIVVILVGVILAISFKGKDKEVAVDNGNKEEMVEQQVAKESLKIVDVNSKSRPFAVMINNNHAAWPQCGLQDAYLVYEIIVEGGITRMLALYKDQDTVKIGSIRSARHYFIDYAEENDAIFVHWGGSPQAYSKISSTGINDIDGIALEGSVFFRDTSLNRAYEHTGFTSMSKLKEYANNKGMARNTNKDLLLRYSAEAVDMENKEDSKTAKSVNIKYSNYHSTSYEYDEENKVYKRSMSGTKNVDLSTGKQYTAKNIIIYKVRNYTLNDGEGKGRQELDNIGNGTGYYVSEGFVIPITWEKTSHSGQTVYKDSSGNKLTVNDGNTYIQICPEDGVININ